MAVKTFSKRGYRSFLRHEQLESRVMLSASPSDVDSSVAEVSTAVVQPKANFQLQITGTEVQFSPIGTPAYMAGTISFVTPNGRTYEGIGRYQETLTPIFMDVNADSVPDFVGTNGVATFSFYAGPAKNIYVGSITTVNVSYIQGVTAAGEMIVGSTGTITACDGLFKKTSGGFTSQSVVAMYPTFAMNTTVNFAINDCQLDPRVGAKILAQVVHANIEAHHNKLKHDLVDAFHGNNDKHADKLDKNTSKADKHSGPAHQAVDSLVERAKDRVNEWTSKRHDKLASDLAHWRHGGAC
jgi:hypothetical protein